MASRKGLAALAGAAVGIGAAAVAERVALNRRRQRDPEADEPLGQRRGERSYTLDLPDGAKVFVEEVGPEGATQGALFIHGSALRNDTWHYQMGGLDSRRLLFCELRGHHKSTPKGRAAYSMETLAQDL